MCANHSFGRLNATDYHLDRFLSPNGDRNLIYNDKIVNWWNQEPLLSVYVNESEMPLAFADSFISNKPEKPCQSCSGVLPQ